MGQAAISSKMLGVRRNRKEQRIKDPMGKSQSSIIATNDSMHRWGFIMVVMYYEVFNIR